MIYKQILNEKVLAMKEGRKEEKDILNLLISKLKNKAIELKQDELDDQNTSQIITKFVKTLDEEILSFEKAERLEKVEILKKQREFVAKFLPKMLSEVEIKEIISKLEDQSLKNIMQTFKQKYQGQVDMGMVSKIAKGL